MTADLDEAVALVQRELGPRTAEQLRRLTADDMLARSAHYYAEVLGWAVFPLKPGGKIPLTRNGFLDATMKLDVIDTWWHDCPTANIGVPTGHAFDCIDIDAPDGFATWARRYAKWREQGHSLPPLVAAAYTGGGGRHLLIEAQGGANGAAWGDGLDYRGSGGYIVLPPSRLANGGIYEWLIAPRAAP